MHACCCRLPEGRAQARLPCLRHPPGGRQSRAASQAGLVTGTRVCGKSASQRSGPCLLLITFFPAGQAPTQSQALSDPCPTPAGPPCTLQNQLCQAPQGSRRVNVSGWLRSQHPHQGSTLYLLLVDPVLPGCNACLELLSMLLGGSILLSSLSCSLQTFETKTGGHCLSACVSPAAGW